MHCLQQSLLDTADTCCGLPCCCVLPLRSVQLHAAYSGSISMQGHLLKHRPVTQLMGLFAQEWEMR